MIYTASFLNFKDFKGEAVSIANSCPKWFNSKQLKSLAPPWDIVKKFKDNKIEWDEFKEKYIKYLESNNITKDLEYIKEKVKNNEDITLLCWERDTVCCHRRLLVEWLIINKIFEIDIDNIR